MGYSGMKRTGKTLWWSTLAVLLLATCECQDYLYSFSQIYDGRSPMFCVSKRCTTFNFVGAKTQTFFAGAKHFYNQDFMPCGLEFQITRITELDGRGHPIHHFDARLDNPQRLFMLLPTNYNFTYCNPQLEEATTTSTGFPFYHTTAVAQNEYYPNLNCTPITSILSSSQVYVTLKSLLSPTLGALSMDLSVFTSSGFVVNVAKNESQFVEPGDARVNFTISRWAWSGYTPATANQPKAESLEIQFTLMGLDDPSEENSQNSGWGPNQVFDLDSGRVTLSGIAYRDGRYVESKPELVATDDATHKSLFRLRIPRFKRFYSYGGVILHQYLNSDCESGVVTG